MLIDDTFLDTFESDMVRLSRRNHSEVGVPMYLVPEDLTGTSPPAPPDPAGQTLADAFVAVTHALAARNGPLSSTDLAQVLEVLADRHFLDVPFSSLSDGTAR